MNLFKKLISKTYSIRINLSKKTGIGIDILYNKENIFALSSFYDLSGVSGGRIINFAEFEGKYVLLVNVASECGFTPQYTELQELQDKYCNDLVVLGFPSNEFAGQEPGNDDTIVKFCKLNFGVTFPIFLKDSVIGKSKQPVYKWLTEIPYNGWNIKEPGWNFCKYLIDPTGNLVAFYSSSVSPLDNAIISKITK